MSRYAKIPLEILDGVDLNIDEKNCLVKVKGPKGELDFKYVEDISVTKKDKQIRVMMKRENKKLKSFVGLTFKMIQNMMIGVTKGFQKILEYSGVGYRMSLKGNVLTMQLGYSHDINYDVPEGVEIELKDQTVIIKSIDKHLVGLVSDKIKSYRPVEPYKGKGIKYKGEYVIRKAGKSAKK